MLEERDTPKYPDLGAGVAKFRRKSLASIYDLSKEERVAYADAIEKAIRAKHRTLHMKPMPAMTPGWYKPPSITRLLHYDNPIPMAGDPDWRHHARDAHRWQDRQAAVYAAMMEEKRSRARLG